MSRIYIGTMGMPVGYSIGEVNAEEDK